MGGHGQRKLTLVQIIRGIVTWQPIVKSRSYVERELDCELLHATHSGIRLQTNPGQFEILNPIIILKKSDFELDFPKLGWM